MAHFTPFSALAGGALIGLSATLLWFLNGRIAGISGLFGDAVLLYREGRATKISFVVGLLAGAAVFAVAHPTSFAASPRSVFTLALAGVLVGLGTRMGNGCTSGHGVCGISRGSLRAFVATITFMLAAMLTVYLVDHVWRIS